MRIYIIIIFFATLLFNSERGFSSAKFNAKQNAFDFFIKFLDTAHIDRKGEIVRFNKFRHKIYFEESPLKEDHLDFQCCNYSISDFILVDSIFHKKIRNDGKFKTESDSNNIKLRQAYIIESSFEDFDKTHMSGDIIMVMGGSVTLGKYCYVHIYFGFGDWIHHDFFIKIDKKGNILDYVICTGVS